VAGPARFVLVVDIIPRAAGHATACRPGAGTGGVASPVAISGLSSVRHQPTGRSKESLIRRSMPRNQNPRTGLRTLFSGDEYRLVAVIWVASFQYRLQPVGERIQAKPPALDL
jgi:hypothetical protein